MNELLLFLLKHVIIVLLIIFSTRMMLDKIWDLFLSFVIFFITINNRTSMQNKHPIQQSSKEN